MSPAPCCPICRQHPIAGGELLLCADCGSSYRRHRSRFSGDALDEMTWAANRARWVEQQKARRLREELERLRGDYKALARRVARGGP